MAKQNVNLRDTIRELRLKYGLNQIVWHNAKQSKECEQLIKESKPVHEGMLKNESNGAFYQIYKANITEQEADEYIRLKQLDALIKIAKCLMFFVVTIIIGFFAGFIALVINFR